MSLFFMYSMCPHQNDKHPLLQVTSAENLLYRLSNVKASNLQQCY